ncbi:MAG: MurR/RpiR family transcriptional regulator [Tissierellia bacterium]|nr:MurR/RpiR family transcriptional regulator [Tissierellia bacterium]
MRKDNSLENIIHEKYLLLSKRQKAIADFLLHSPDVHMDMTAKQVAQKLLISESTVVRFAQELDLEGYRDLQELMNDYIKSTSTTVDRLSFSSDSTPQTSFIQSAIESEITTLRKAKDNLNLETFVKIVDSLNTSKRVFILGCRTSYYLASYLAFYMRLIKDNVFLLGNNHTTIYEEMASINEGDVLFVFSFPRYTNASVDIASLARNNGAKIIAMTDNENNRISRISDLVLSVDNNILFFVDSLAAPMAILNAMIVELSMLNKQQTINSLSKMEKIWQTHKIFETKEQ